MTDQPQLFEDESFDHYQVEIRAGQLFDEQVLRSHSAGSVDDALNLLDGIRDAYAQRDEVTWDGEEVDAGGKLRGLDPSGRVYLLSVTPPLTVALS
jgi:hypothetical protein